MCECINLKEQFEKRYKIGWDPCYDPAHRPEEKLDPWYMTIPCQFGTITPYGGTTLSVMVDYHPVAANRLVNSGVCKLYQDGDHEKTFLFDVADIATVAAIVKPKRKRTLSEDHKRKLLAAGKTYWFPSRHSERLQEAPTHSEAPA